MTRTLPDIRAGFMALCILSISVFFAAPASGLSAPGQEGSNKINVASESVRLLAKGGVSVGLTKKEVYDGKGVPDKINRMSGETGREMWVYQCQNEDGYDEDCLHLYFDDDRLVKIDRL